MRDFEAFQDEKGMYRQLKTKKKYISNFNVNFVKEYKFNDQQFIDIEVKYPDGITQIKSIKWIELITGRKYKFLFGNLQSFFIGDYNDICDIVHRQIQEYLKQKD